MPKMPPRWRELLQIAWPLIIANSFWNLQLTIDRIFLGQLSTESLGAAMSVMGVFWVPMALLQQTVSYVGTFVAQYFGADKSRNIGACVWQSLYISVVGGLAFLCLNLLSEDFFTWVGHSSEVRRLEIEYFDSVAFSALPTAVVAAVSGFFMGLGHTRKIIVINCVGLVLNIVLDYVMIFGKWGFPAMGVAGAGYATAIATYGSALFGIYLITRPENERRFGMRSDWKPDLAIIKSFIRYGVPSGLQWSLEGLAFTVFLIVMGSAKQGDVALASSSIAVTLMMLSVLPSMGVAQAVMTVVGQSLGAKSPERAQESTWVGVQISLIYMATVALSLALVPDLYLSWFRNDQNPELWAAVRDLSVSLLRIVAIFTLFDSVYLNISFALKAAGDTRFVSLIALAVPWPVMVLPAYLCRHLDRAAEIAWGFGAIYAMLTAFILFLRFRSGRWKSINLLESLNRG
jgi:MATE family multidrug resistance protein